MSRKTISTTILVAAGLFPILAEALADDASLRKRVLAEYPQALERIEAKYGRAQGVVHLERVSVPPKYVITIPREERPGTEIQDLAFMSRLPEMARVVAQLPDSKLNDEFVTCFNARYGFRLAKGKGQSALAVKSVDPDREEEVSDAFRFLMPYLGAPYSVMHLRLPRYVSLPTFRIVDVSPVSSGGNRLVRITFDLSLRVNEKNTSGGYEGWFVVSPDERWVVREYEYRPKKGKVKWTGSVEYQGGSDDYPFLKRVTTKSALLDGTDSVTETYDFREFRFAEVPENEFTLSAFGMPELLDPPGGEKAGSASGRPSGTTPSAAVSRTSNAWVWYVAIGFGSLAAAIALKLASSRLAARGSVASGGDPGSA